MLLRKSQERKILPSRTLANTSNPMDLISEHISKRDFKSLVDTCEQLEFDLSLYPSEAISLHEIYAPLIGGYLLLNDLNSARFLHKRISPSIIAASPEIQAIWAVSSALWQRQHTEVYHAIDAFQWGGVMQPLVVALAENLRERAFHLMAEAYSSIAVAEAAIYMGFSPEQTVEVLTTKGWILDTATNTLQPVKTPTPAAQSTNLEQFGRLADMVVHLEKA